MENEHTGKIHLRNEKHLEALLQEKNLAWIGRFRVMFSLNWRGFSVLRENGQRKTKNVHL